MTVKVTATSIKSDGVNFPDYNQAFEDHLTANYVSTGKLVSKETIKTKVNESDDDLNKRELVMVFDSAASFNEFQADPVRIEARAARDAYFAEHGITTTDTVVEYIAPDVAPA
jgi:hypothetical protein